MADGWIKLWRKTLDNPFLHGSALRKALFIDLLLRAAHEPKSVVYRGRFYDLRPGQCVVSMNDLAKANGATFKQIRVALGWLKRGTMVGTAGEVITICNWLHYQAEGHDEGTSQGTTRARRGHTEQEREEGEEGKKESPHATHGTPKGANGLNGQHRGSRLKEDWEPGEEGVAYARKLGLSTEAINEAYHEFMRYWLSKAGANARKVDWGLTWQTWVRRTYERYREKEARERSWRERYGAGRG